MVCERKINEIELTEKEYLLVNLLYKTVLKNNLFYLIYQFAGTNFEPSNHCNTPVQELAVLQPTKPTLSRPIQHSRSEIKAKQNFDCVCPIKMAQ